MNLTGSVQCLTSKDRMNSQNVLILAKPNSGASVSFTKILPETINFKPQESVAHKHNHTLEISYGELVAGEILNCTEELLKNISDRYIGLRACLHGGGGSQVGEVTRLGGVTRLSK